MLSGWVLHVNEEEFQRRVLCSFSVLIFHLCNIFCELIIFPSYYSFFNLIVTMDLQICFVFYFLDIIPLIYICISYIFLSSTYLFIFLMESLVRFFFCLFHSIYLFLMNSIWLFLKLWTFKRMWLILILFSLFFWTLTKITFICISYRNSEWQFMAFGNLSRHERRFVKPVNDIL